MIKTEYKHSELTGRIIGCAMTVHTALGSGFKEIIYQKALAIELADQGINFIREKEMSIYFKNHLLGKRKVDFLVENTVCLELKARVQLDDDHLAQAINYLECSDREVGLLINFGSKSLQYKRLRNKQFKQKNQGNPLI